MKPQNLEEFAINFDDVAKPAKKKGGDIAIFVIMGLGGLAAMSFLACCMFKKGNKRKG